MTEKQNWVSECWRRKHTLVKLSTIRLLGLRKQLLLSILSKQDLVWCQESKLDWWGEGEGWVTVRKKRSGAGLTAGLYQGRRGGEKSLIAAQIGEGEINGKCWEREWSGRWQPVTNVAVRADDGTALWASLTGSRCFKASLFLAGTPLLKFVYTYVQLQKWSVFKCISYLLGLLKNYCNWEKKNGFCCISTQAKLPLILTSRIWCDVLCSELSMLQYFKADKKSWVKTCERGNWEQANLVQIYL